MTKEQEERRKKFFAMLASHGVTEVFCVSPPEGGGAIANIEPNGELSMVDKRDGKRKKITIP